MEEIKIKNTFGFDKSDIQKPVRICDKNTAVPLTIINEKTIGHIKDVTKDEITIVLYCDVVCEMLKCERVATLLAF